MQNNKHKIQSILEFFALFVLLIILIGFIKEKRNGNERRRMA